MSKYELSLSPDYVPEWGIVEAVRELFQNALDQQATEEHNEMFFDYDGSRLLRIGNRNSVLAAQSLLMGSTTKKGDENTIGQHGEGYKVATLVLARLGKHVVFYNYGAKEVWRPRLVNSKRYGTQILTFFVDKQFVWNFIPDSNLTITIEGVTPSEYASIVESNLHLQDVGAVLNTPKGRILTEERYKGKIFVSGLFVCNYPAYAYGYDFKPQYIELDRDRKLISDFDLQWLSSSMWHVANQPEALVELAKEGKADAVYAGSQFVTEASSVTYDTAYKTFKEENGENAVPVCNQDDMDNLGSAYKAVIVTSTYQKLITQSCNYEAPVKVAHISPATQFTDWFEGVRFKCTGDEVATFEALVDQLATKFGA